MDLRKASAMEKGRGVGAEDGEGLGCAVEDEDWLPEEPVLLEPEPLPVAALFLSL